MNDKIAMREALILEASHIPRRSISHGGSEIERALATLSEQMERLRRAETASRLAGHAFRKALREVTECQQALAEAAARVQRIPGQRTTASPGSV